MKKSNKTSLSLRDKNVQTKINYSMVTHILIGVGLGILLTYPVAGAHPLRWGIGLLALGVIAYLYPQLAKK